MHSAQDVQSEGPLVSGEAVQGGVQDSLWQGLHW